MEKHEMSNFKKYIPWVLVSVLVVLLIWSLTTDSGEPEVIERHTTDTLTIVKKDTVYITKVKTMVKRVVDTTYITINDTTFVPILRKKYNFTKDGLFDFNVKGYDVEFIDAKVYPETIYQTITNEKEVLTTKYRSSLFVNVGFSSICGTFAPKAGLSLSLKGNWLIGAEIGIYEKKPFYGASVGYNVLKK